MKQWVEWDKGQKDATARDRQGSELGCSNRIREKLWEKFKCKINRNSDYWWLNKQDSPRTKIVLGCRWEKKDNQLVLGIYSVRIRDEISASYIGLSKL